MSTYARLLATVLLMPGVAHAYIFIGNPSVTATVEAERLEVAIDLGSPVTVAASSVGVAELGLWGCPTTSSAGERYWIPVQSDVDLASGWTVHLPPGEWCEVEVVLDSALWVMAEDEQGAAEVWEADLDRVIGDSAVALPEWLSISLAAE